MKNAIGDDCHFVLDVKQCLRSHVEIDAMLVSMGRNIVHIHLSDHTAAADCLLPGNGRFDFGAFFAKQQSNSTTNKDSAVFINYPCNTNAIIIQ